MNKWAASKNNKALAFFLPDKLTKLSNLVEAYNNLTKIVVTAKHLLVTIVYRNYCFHLDGNVATTFSDEFWER